MKIRVTWFYYVGRWLMVFLLRLLTNWEVRGSENVPATGAVLVISNHLHAADPPLVAVSLRRKTIFMAKEELFRSKIIAYFIRGFGAFPVHRGKIDFSSLRRAKEALTDGMGLVMFPEGTRSRNGSLRPAFPGSALIAVQNKVPILPVGITGTEKLTGISWLFKRPRIIVTIGKPFALPQNGTVRKEQLTELTDYIMCRIAELLPEKYHGCYAEKVAEGAYRKVG